jgi:hypothetical protein
MRRSEAEAYLGGILDADAGVLYEAAPSTLLRQGVPASPSRILTSTLRGLGYRRTNAYVCRVRLVQPCRPGTLLPISDISMRARPSPPSLWRPGLFSGS